MQPRSLPTRRYTSMSCYITNSYIWKSVHLLLGQTLYVCVYVSMYVCVYVCTYICMYVRMYVRMGMFVCYVRMYVCVCVYIYIYIYIYTHTYVCMCVCVCVCVCVCMYVCVCVCVCVCVHMYICFIYLFQHAPLLWRNTTCFKCAYYKTSVLIQGMLWPTSNLIS